MGILDIIIALLPLWLGIIGTIPLGLGYRNERKKLEFEKSRTIRELETVRASAADVVSDTALTLITPLKTQIDELYARIKVSEIASAKLADSRIALEKEVYDLRLIVKEYEKEIRYNILIRLTTTPFVLLSQTTGCIVDVNFGATTVYGYSREEMLGMEYTSLFKEKECIIEALNNNRVSLKAVQLTKGHKAMPMSIQLAYFSRFGENFCMTLSEQDVQKE